MDMDRWCKEAEELRAALGDAYWNMRVGLPYSEETIKSLEAANGKHHENFLASGKEPRLIFIDALDCVSSANAVDASLEFEEARKTKICSKVDGQSICWTTWRQWASTAPDKSRKEVFDTFIEKVPAITPLIKHRFDLAMEVFEANGTDPLKTFVEHHHISVDRLRGIVEELRDTTKPLFKTQFKEWANKLFGRDPEYHDDFYCMRNKVYEDISGDFSKVDSLGHCLKTLRDMGLDPSSIKLDDADRPGKYPSPFCTFVRTPTDVRVSFKKENPLNTAISAYHEFGHAIHAVNIDPKLSYSSRNLLSMGLAESFSTFYEDALSDTHYLTRELGLKTDIANEFVRRNKFHNLYAISFYCANSLFRIDTYDKKVPFEKWDDLYAKHIKECMGIRMPGAYWQLHHILPESLMYVPSYLLAFMRSTEMTNTLRTDCGETWYKSPRAGKQLKEWMKPGQDSPLALFSKLNVRGFLKGIRE